MNDPPPPVQDAPAAPLLAVQQDTAAILVDWQLFHDWDRGDGAFSGAIFIIAADGHHHTALPWTAPTDAAADTALRTAGWVRGTDWARDPAGRRVASVAPAADVPGAAISPPLPQQRPPRTEPTHKRPTGSAKANLDQNGVLT